MSEYDTDAFRQLSALMNRGIFAGGGYVGQVIGVGWDTTFGPTVTIRCFDPVALGRLLSAAAPSTGEREWPDSGCQKCAGDGTEGGQR